MSQIIEFDCATGKQTVREMTPEEIELRRAQVVELERLNAEREAELARVAALKESAKNKLVAGQPLTEEEASVITL